MKDKIFQKLKQGYSHLGLGDEVLQAHAESLSATGLVTDDNIETVVNAQKTFLEGLQKNYDTRVTSATAKAKEAAKKEFEDAAKAAAAEKERKEKEERERKEKEKVMPDWYKTEKAESEKAIKELLDSVKTMKDGYEAMKSENEALKKREADAARKNLIVSKAKELGIPQYRIEEGFAIAEDADEAKIGEYLAKVANNAKTMSLPGNKSTFPLDGLQPSADDVKNIAKSLVK